MSQIQDLLNPETIVARAKWASRKQVISELSEKLAKAHALNPAIVYEAVIEREKLGSTGVGEGVAIPHARVEGVDHPIGAFARLEEAVDFDAIDERDCDLIFLLLCPVDSGADHLRALAKVSRVMRQSDVRDALRHAQSVDAVLDAFTLSNKSQTSAA